MSQPEPSLAARVRTAQIIAVALILGSTTFLGIVIFLVQKGGEIGKLGEGDLPILSLLAVGFLVVQASLVVAWPNLVVPRQLNTLAASAPDKHVMPAMPRQSGGPISDAGFLFTTYLMLMIVRMALLEGTSFFASIAYLLEGRPLALAVSVLAILGLLALFPTEGRVSRWLAQKRGEVADLRARQRVRPS